MKLGIMQPYFFPYIGYWQLLNAVDRYVIYDDVNYINRGWVNRNRILLNGQAVFVNVPCHGLSQNKLINENIASTDEIVIEKQLRKIREAYRKAPYYEEVFPLINKVMCSEISNLSEYLINLIKTVCDYLEIHTEVLISSKIDKNNTLKGQEKILAINRLLGATEYYNAIGGQELYSRADFENAGIKLSFLKAGDITYSQFTNEFVPNLSIIDVMMFNSKEQIQEMLKDYTLV